MPSRRGTNGRRPYRGLHKATCLQSVSLGRTGRPDNGPSGEIRTSAVLRCLCRRRPSEVGARTRVRDPRCSECRRLVLARSRSVRPRERADFWGLWPTKAARFVEHRASGRGRVGFVCLASRAGARRGIEGRQSAAVGAPVVVLGLSWRSTRRLSGLWRMCRHTRQPPRHVARCRSPRARGATSSALRRRTRHSSPPLIAGRARRAALEPRPPRATPSSGPAAAPSRTRPSSALRRASGSSTRRQAPRPPPLPPSMMP
jgi:hypothetical protein